MTHTAVDVQGFAGAFTLGMVQAGFELLGKMEMDDGFGSDNCLANRGLLGNRWDLQLGPQQSWENRGAEVVFGNPPCSAFSALTTNKDFKGLESPMSHRMWAMAQYTARALPYITVFESVQQAYKVGLPMMRNMRAWLEYETSQPWTLYHVLHNNASVGGGSIRRRYFWVVSRIPFGIEQPEVDRVPTLEDVLGDLVGIPESWEPQQYYRDASWWAEREVRSPSLVDGHIGRNDSPIAHRAAALLKGTYWSQGETINKVIERYYTQHGNLPQEWERQQDRVIDNGFQMGFHQPYRMKWNKMARVITGGALFDRYHPIEDRFITHREAARIQGFPDTWTIQKHAAKATMWGKGIPVQAGRWIGQWLHAALDGAPGTNTGELIGDREYMMNCTENFRSATTER